MIRHIHLARWRAYEELDLAFTHPVTFFVAPNGAGKTSLIEAVRWGLLGTPDGRSLGGAVRSGHDTATVRLGLSLPGHPNVQVTRFLRRSGTTAFSAVMDGVAIDERRYRSILAGEWSADVDLLDGLIFGPTTSGRATGFPVRDHLTQVFGVQRLLDGAARVKERRDEVDQGAVVAAAREDLVLEVTQKALTVAAERYTTERVDPLAYELTRRWGIVFGDEGLRFTPDGRLSSGHDDVDVALGDLSSGERATALLITRLLLAGDATRASMVWLEEPLAHLDPRRRAVVGQTIVRVAETGVVNQIVVATYEEGLARHLAAATPDTVELAYASDNTARN